MDKRQQYSVWFVLIAVLTLVSMQSYLSWHTETLSHSDFKRLSSGGMLENLTVSETAVRGTKLLLAREMLIESEPATPRQELSIVAVRRVAPVDSL